MTDAEVGGVTRRIALNEGQHAIVGYGSLFSRPSLERTLGHTYTRPFVPCHVDGWRRSWDVAMPNDTYAATVGGERVYPREVLYLNVRPVPGSLMVAVLFVVETSELGAYDAREWIYDRVRITAAVRDVELIGGDAWMYVGKSEYARRHVLDWPEAGVRASYLRIVDAGLAAFDSEVRVAFDQSTDPVPANLVFEDEAIGG